MEKSLTHFSRSWRLRPHRRTTPLGITTYYLFTGMSDFSLLVLRRHRNARPEGHGRCKGNHMFLQILSKKNLQNSGLPKDQKNSVSRSLPVAT